MDGQDVPRIGTRAADSIDRFVTAMIVAEPGVRLGDDAEPVHQMRVAIRRLRATLSLLREYLPANAGDPRQELAWIAGSLGEVRDLDVQIDQARAWHEAAEGPEHTDRSPLVDRLQERRSAARERLIGELDSDRFRSLVRDLKHLIEEARSNTAGEPVSLVAPGLIRRRYRQLRRDGDRIGADPGRPEAMHRLRIRVKRLRYALEIFEDLYGRPARSFIRRLTDLQDLLGAYQDATVGAARLAELIAPAGDAGPAPEEPRTPTELAGRYADRATELRAAFPAAYGRVKGKPWRRLRRVLAKRRAAAAGTRIPRSVSAMDLYLVRHAIAGEHDPVAWPDDSQRPLTDKGVKRFRRAAKGLRGIVRSVDLILSSPFVRAWDTARILAKETGWPKPIACEALAVGGSPRAVLDALQEHATTGSIALVGHDPNLSELASFLMTGDPDRVRIDFKKGGVICLSLPIELSSRHGALSAGVRAETDNADERQHGQEGAGHDDRARDEDASRRRLGADETERLSAWDSEGGATATAPAGAWQEDIAAVTGLEPAEAAAPDHTPPVTASTEDGRAPELTAGSAELRWVVTPRLLREL